MAGREPELMAAFVEFWQSLSRELSFNDAIDILLVSFLFYKLFQLVRGGRAFQMVVGTLLLILLFFASRWADLTAVNWLLRNTLAYIGFAIIVLYQQELRRGLANLGRAPLFRFLNPTSSKGTLDEVAFSLLTLAERRVGAILVLERDIGLRSYVEAGVMLDAVVTYDLLLSVFNPKSPLHDGAVIIQGDRAAAAACFLPIAINPQLGKEFGTRHRAAIGISEDTDAIAIVASEETGLVSFMEDGAIVSGLDAKQLRSKLRDAMGQKDASPTETRTGSVSATERPIT
jgi:diadenylate cyclase